VAAAFLKGVMPERIERDLEAFLAKVRIPLSVRSSSLLEDAHFHPYAGLYRTYMIPNNHPDPSTRLRHLLDAVRLIYASTYYQGPKAFSRRISGQPEAESMAVIVQQLAGREYGDHFYPAISGVAQSHNYYPFAPMRREEGIAHIVLGLGKGVAEGEKSLRFSPRHPTILPQFSSVKDVLNAVQRFFWALRIRNFDGAAVRWENSNLERRYLEDAADEFPVKALASTYIQEEDRIRDTGYFPGPKVLTFAPVLKHGAFPLPRLLCDLLAMGRKGMGCPVEMEFSVDLSGGETDRTEFHFLQIRPLIADQEGTQAGITAGDLERAFCRSGRALGNGKYETMADIVYVKPEDFDVSATVQIAEEIDAANARLVKEGRPYLLVGPGRWGSADRLLGIPVQWRHISGVGAIIELRTEKLKPEPSQGSHFFQNITALGIPYVTVTEEPGSEDRLDWDWMNSLSARGETAHVRHVRLKKPMVLKIDARTSQCVIMRPVRAAGE